MFFLFCGSHVDASRMHRADATTADLNGVYSCILGFSCCCREHFVLLSFFTVVNLSFASEEHLKICHYHIVAEANKNTLTPAASHIICAFREEECGF